MKSEDETIAMDFNAVLRQEVLHYATTGIRVCASKKTDQLSKKKVVLIIHQTNNPLKSIFNMNALMKMVFSGRDVIAPEASDSVQDSVQVWETQTIEIDEEGGQATGRNTLTATENPLYADAVEQESRTEGDSLEEGKRNTAPSSHEEANNGNRGRLRSK